jgi:uncharacterized protein (DUF983 family)
MSWKSALLVVHVVTLPLYFQWATQACRACRHEWDLPNTRTYPLIAVLLCAAIIGVTLTLLFNPYCVNGTTYWFVFPTGLTCRG